MKNKFHYRSVLFLWAFVFLVTGLVYPAEKKSDADPQYELDDRQIPAATEAEEVLKIISTKSALEYVELGAKAWTKNNSCVSCHTNGTYLFTRPELSKQLGTPSKEIRDFFASRLKEFQKMPEKKVNKGTNPAGVIYIAAGLANWDKHLSGKTSKETQNAIRLMLSLQKEKGTWPSQTCWPPFESSSYQLATMAAMAVGDAPDWISQTKDTKQLEQFKKLKTYLVKTPPPHNYGKVLLLWAATRIPELVDSQKKEEIVNIIREKQHDDGGWAIRDFAKPEEWGGGNRANKLKKETKFSNPPSDGHQTGLAVIVLLDAGIPIDDPQIQKAVHWLKTNQRSSGRWWTRSLNTDGSHYITYSATCYALLALAKCNELPKSE